MGPHRGAGRGSIAVVLAGACCHVAAAYGIGFRSLPIGVAGRRRRRAFVAATAAGLDCRRGVDCEFYWPHRNLARRPISIEGWPTDPYLAFLQQLEPPIGREPVPPIPPGDRVSKKARK